MFRHKKVQGSQRDNYHGKINRRAHSFVQLTQNSIHITQRRPDRLKHILNSWKMLTRDQGILSVVGYKIPFSTRARLKKKNMKYPYDCSTGEIGGYGNFGDADKGSYLSGSERS